MPALDNGVIVYFPLLIIIIIIIVIIRLILNKKITGKTEADNTKEVEIIVLLKYVSNFWGTLEMHLINCEINLFLTWSYKLVLSNAAAQAKKFETTDTKLCFPLVTLSTQDNAKL